MAVETNRPLLLTVIGISFVLHIAALFLLHNKTLHSFTSTLTHGVLTFEEESFDILQKRERTAQLAHIFSELSEAPAEVKEDLAELKPEFTPTASFEFPEGEPFMIHDGSFAFDTDPLDFLSSDEGTLTLWDANSVIYESPMIASTDLPLMADFMSERSLYDGLEMLAGSDHFDITVEYAQKQHRPGYVFKILFTPKRDVIFRRIGQNYYFLLDRSNSIPRARFALNKEIVKKALDYLKPNDTFNIMLFDNKVCRLNEEPLPWNLENLRKAQTFLEEQNHGGYFAATELYSSLDKVIPTNVSDQEVNTAILLSDGDSYLPLDKQRQTIGGWTKKNKGKVSLFAIASGGGNNLPLLDLITSFNKGGLIYTYDHDQLSDKIAELLLMIRNPIGKEMVATAVTPDKQAIITLQPGNGRLPDLYQNKPFVIYGSTNKLSDFVLFLQGKYYDHRFDIKKQISFSQAQIGSPLIEKAWTQLIAHDFYENFLEDGNKKHLDAAKQLLAPLNLPVPFRER